MSLPPARPPREPAINVPKVVLALIGSFVLVHLLRLSLSDTTDLQFLNDMSFVPARVTLMLGWQDVEGLLGDIARSGAADADQQLQLAHFFLGDGESKPWTLITYAFLHADLTHLGVNSVWMLAFGGAVARRFATVRFLCFIAFCTVAAALAQWIANTISPEPVIGASGAISGMMGAAMRFMFRDEIRLGPGAERYAKLPRLSLAESFRNRRVVAFILMLLAVNILFAVGFQLLTPSGARIAWEAHVGGFAAGLFGFALFDPIPAAPTPG